MQTNLPEYTRTAFLEKAGPFLEKLKNIAADPQEETLILAGVDFSHIGPKFGHSVTADALQSKSEAHDKSLLAWLAARDAVKFWEESKKVGDQYNVCGFAALACLLEILPECTGKVLDYQFWKEEATRSGVGFAAAVFTV